MILTRESRLKTYMAIQLRGIVLFLTLLGGRCGRYQNRKVVLTK